MRTKFLVALIGLQALDLLTTLVVIHNGGCEANPVIKALFPYLGVVGSLILIKLLTCSFAMTLRGKALYIGVAAYTLIVGWNSLIIAAIHLLQNSHSA